MELLVWEFVSDSGKARFIFVSLAFALLLALDGVRNDRGMVDLLISLSFVLPPVFALFQC